MVRVNDLLGTWRLDSARADLSDGSTTFPYGRDPRGVLIYLPDGTMAAIITDPRRPPFADDAIAGTTPDEALAALRGTVAYFGTYESIDDGTVLHRVTASLFPNWVGTEQTRHLALTGDRLTITTPPAPASRGRQVVFTLEWLRAPGTHP